MTIYHPVFIDLALLDKAVLVCPYRLGLYDVPATVLVVADLVIVRLTHDLSVYRFSFHFSIKYHIVSFKYQ